MEDIVRLIQDKRNFAITVSHEEFSLNFLQDTALITENYKFIYTNDHRFYQYADEKFTTPKQQGKNSFIVYYRFSTNTDLRYIIQRILSLLSLNTTISSISPTNSKKVIIRTIKEISWWLNAK